MNNYGRSGDRRGDDACRGRCDNDAGRAGICRRPIVFPIAPHGSGHYPSREAVSGAMTNNIFSMTFTASVLIPPGDPADTTFVLIRSRKCNSVADQSR